jgi:golgi phosphoprotein 3
MPNEALTLQEALLLLCLNDRTGKLEAPYLRYGLNAAALAELHRQGRIVVEGGKVALVNPAPIGDELLEVAMSRLAGSRRPGRLSAWVRVLYRDRKLPIEVLTNRLVRRGILTRREAPLFWFFHRTVYPTSDPGPEQAVRQRIQEILLQERGRDDTTVILIALLRAGRALQLVMDKPTLKQLRPILEALCASNLTAHLMGQALARAIAEDEAATAAAIVAAGSG